MSGKHLRMFANVTLIDMHALHIGRTLEEHWVESRYITREIRNCVRHTDLDNRSNVATDDTAA